MGGRRSEVWEEGGARYGRKEERGMGGYDRRSEVWEVMIGDRD